MATEQDLQQLKVRIAEVYARREWMKKALENGTIASRAGLVQLEATDLELSDLDSRFKVLWDVANSRSSPAPHSAARWAQDTVFEPIHLDCVTAIMLKILDAKCKMGEADQIALAAIYDVVRNRPGQCLDGAVHDLIAAARRQSDDDLNEPIHAWRVRAEAHIPKPVMKGFKQLLRDSLPRH